MDLTEAEDIKKRWQEYTEEKCKKEKWLSEEDLNAEFQRIARRDKKAFLSDQCKEIEENNRMGKNRESLQENQRYQGNTLGKDGHNKGQKWYGPDRNGKR